jgi:hypothetical protein
VRLCLSAWSSSEPAMNPFVVSTSGNIESFHPLLGSLVRSSSPPSNNVIAKLSNSPRTCSSGCRQCGIEAIGMSSVQQCAPPRWGVPRRVSCLIQTYCVLPSVLLIKSIGLWGPNCRVWSLWHWASPILATVLCPALCCSLFFHSFVPVECRLPGMHLAHYLP